MSDDYEFCVLTEEKDIIEYEKGAYEAFLKSESLEWIKENFQIINNNQLKSSVPYFSNKKFMQLKKNQK